VHDYIHSGRDGRPGTAPQEAQQVKQ
jgi:hypothetical protein